MVFPGDTMEWPLKQLYAAVSAEMAGQLAPTKSD
jgi:hypothetical protein